MSHCSYQYVPRVLSHCITLRLSSDLPICASWILLRIRHVQSILVNMNDVPLLEFRHVLPRFSLCFLRSCRQLYRFRIFDQHVLLDLSHVYRHPSLKPLLFTWGHGSDRGFLRGFGSSSLRPRWWRQRDRWEDLAPTADAFTMVLAREIQDVSTRSNYQPFSFDQLRIEGILQGLF